MKNRKQPIIPISYPTTSKRSDDGGTGKKKIPAWQRRTLTFFLKYNRVIIAQCLAFLVFWRTKSFWFPSSNSSTPNLSVVQEEILALRTIQKERRLEYDETVIDYFDRDAESKYYRWLDPKMTPPTTSTPDDFLEDGADNLMLETLRESRAEQKRLREELNGHQFKKLMREGLIEHFRDTGEPTDWHRKVDNFVSYQDADKIIGPRVDYTLLEYEYEKLIASPPLLGGYPALEPLGDLLKRWPQDDLENPPQPYKEKLQRFNYSDPAQRQMAEKFRDNELPFKVYDIPEIDLANLKWTDAYLSHNFDRSISDVIDNPNLPPRAQGACLSSQDSFFSFFIPRNWFTKVMGPPPTVDTDNMSFEEWSQHARYADRVSLPRNERHFYYQSGVPREERYKPKKEWSFVSRDLPSFSDPGYTFFGFNPDEQKGIQCRFGERGVTAATHYDAGRNMVAMITGAKRYILAPPKQCKNLGIVNKRQHPIFRHSMLNFGHVDLLEDKSKESILETMPEGERAWLEKASQSMAIETVLKAGEVLYIPSHWFHYIISLQKSAQCNTRSGRNYEGSEEFGGYKDIKDCVGKDA